MAMIPETSRYASDMSPEEFEVEKEKYMNILRDEAINRDEIERKTILQVNSELWQTLRGRRLTASNFHSICKRQQPGSRALVKSIVYPPSLDKIPAIQHGRENEPRAIKQLEEQENIKIDDCGFFIDEHLPFLGASPDGIFDSGIIEIKCPSSAYRTSPDDGVKEGKIKFWRKNGEVNINDKWYYQIQGQLHITQKDVCVFAVWTGEEFPLKTARITRDDEFWRNKMETKLINFFDKCFLPEKVDSRMKRGLEIRDESFVEPRRKTKGKKDPECEAGVLSPRQEYPSHSGSGVNAEQINLASGSTANPCVPATTRPVPSKRSSSTQNSGKENEISSKAKKSRPEILESKSTPPKY